MAEFDELLVVHPPASVNATKQCCAHQVVGYMRPPLLACNWCDRAYDMTTGEQIENWAYRRYGDGFIMTKEKACAHVIRATWPHQKSSGLSVADFMPLLRGVVDEFQARYRELFA